MTRERIAEGVITGVIPGSICYEVGIRAGDRLLTVNDQPLEDLIDYKYLTSDEELVLRVRKPDGNEWLVEIEKEYDEDLGLEFESATFDAMRHCANRCMFCFINQNPPDMRASLYVYDDDYRLSFLYGQFVTLTNLRQRDWDRIARLHLSPMYVSIHTLDPDLRERMLGTPRARAIREHLDFLQAHGIAIHAQIVLCPGINDGQHLEYTVQELAKYYPTVLSVAVVPVGLTKYRDHLPSLKPVQYDDACALINQVDKMQMSFLQDLGTRFVWVADEVYVAHGLPLPNEEFYEDMPQTENGVGITRLFLNTFFENLAQTNGHPRSRNLNTIVTGVLGGKVLEPCVERLIELGVRIQLYPIHNHLFGESVTATGLVTGRDIITQLEGRPLGDEILLPRVMLRQQGSSVFLDDVSLEQLKQALQVPVVVLDGADHLVEHLIE